MGFGRRFHLYPAPTSYPVPKTTTETSSRCLLSDEIHAISRFVIPYVLSADTNLNPKPPSCARESTKPSRVYRPNSIIRAVTNSFYITSRLQKSLLNTLATPTKITKSCKPARDESSSGFFRTLGPGIPCTHPSAIYMPPRNNLLCVLPAVLPAIYSLFYHV